MAKKKIPPAQKSKGLRKKRGSSGGAILTVIIIALITVVIGILLLTKYGEKLPSFLIPQKPEIKTVNLYFSGDEGIALNAEKREIAKGSLTKEIKQSIEGLINGPKARLIPTIPDGTRFLGVEIKEGVAFLNFSKEISEKHPGGSSAELQTIYSIVNTITLNFHEVKRVQFLIEGKKAKTLAGHIDISFPLGHNKDFIKR
ncbi:MAG: GerMN domain-containing protein [Deltaproteobacteria bacterium]|nr:GerMN domain-containing protein [Deltaproteobacteria bacterium]